MGSMRLRIGSAVLAIALAGAAVPLQRTGAAGANLVPVPPTITAGYYNALPGFDILVSGQHFSPLGHADVLILEQGGVRAHQVVLVSPLGTFVDHTGLACDFQEQAITAYDRLSAAWSNQAVLGRICPG